MATDQLERRFAGTCGIEERGDGKAVITGYAAVFYRDGDPDTEFELWPGLVERIAPGAFNRALRERDDARALLNHNPNLLLGRASSGTLRLSVDSVGLRYEIEPPGAQYATDAIESIKRGDLSGSSFAFNAKTIEMRSEESRDIRILKDVELFDVGPVTYPAYEGTSVGMRSKRARDDWDDWKYVQKRQKEIEEWLQQQH